MTVAASIVECAAAIERIKADLRAAHAQVQRLMGERDGALAALRNREALGEAVWRVEAERDAYRSMLCDLMAAAHPSERDPPAVSTVRARARELLKDGPK